MIKKEAYYNAKEFVRKNCSGDDWTLHIKTKDSHEMRFAQNAMTQHITGVRHQVSVAVSFGTKTGSATGNGLDENSLKTLLEKAESIAKINKDNPEFMPSRDFVELPKINNFSEATAKYPLEKMVENINKAIDFAKSEDAVLAGMNNRHLIHVYHVTKNGFEGWNHSSSYGHSMTIRKENIETKTSISYKNVEDFSIENEISKLSEQFNSLKNQVHITHKKMNVILRPAAVIDLFGFLRWTMDRRYADDGFTPFTDQLEKEFFGKNFTMRSAINEENLHSQTFDENEVIAENIDWVRNGILKNLKCGRYWAKENNIEATKFSNIIIDGGDATEEEMMKEVGDGLIINRLWYIRFIDMKRGELTGLTRDGVLQFKDGKITNAVTNFRWNEIPHEVTHRILKLGKSVAIDTDCKVPTMLIKDFNFVDSTTF